MQARRIDVSGVNQAGIRFEIDGGVVDHARLLRVERGGPDAKLFFRGRDAGIQFQ